MAFSPAAQAIFNNPQKRAFLQSGNVIRTQTSPTQTNYNYSTPQGQTLNQSQVTGFQNPGSTVQGGGIVPPPTVTTGNNNNLTNEVNNRENQVRGEINSGFDAYFGQLDSMLGNMGGQQAGQEQIVNNNYTQGVSDIQAQQQSSLGDLNTQRRKNEEVQVKNLNDIAENISNLFRTANITLGTRGAGDSPTASKQYAYALTKLGSKERGNVMSQTRSIENDIQDREAKLNNIVTQETTRLKTDRDNNILQVAQYFQDQQNALLQAKAQGQLQKGQSLAQLSTQLLQVAQQKLMQFDADFKNKENTLMSWAANNATNINQLKSNLATVGQYNAPGIQTNDINGAPQFDAQGNMTNSFYGGAGRADEKNPNNLGLFGNALYQ